MRKEFDMMNRCDFTNSCLLLPWRCRIYFEEYTLHKVKGRSKDSLTELKYRALVFFKDTSCLPKTYVRYFKLVFLYGVLMPDLKVRFL